MGEYLIGFYNPKVDDVELLKNCNIIFSDYEELKQHLRKNDVVILGSYFSLWGVDSYDFVSVLEKRELRLFFADEISNREKSEVTYEKSNTINCVIQIVVANIEFIREKKETVRKLLN